MKYKFKASDDKTIHMKIKKWGHGYATSDLGIPAIAEKQKYLDDRYNKELNGDPSMFGSKKRQATLKIVFSAKIATKLSDEIKRYHKYPTYYELRDVYYNVKDGTLFINFFTEIRSK